MTSSVELEDAIHYTITSTVQAVKNVQGCAKEVRDQHALRLLSWQFKRQHWKFLQIVREAVLEAVIEAFVLAAKCYSGLVMPTSGLAQLQDAASTEVMDISIRKLANAVKQVEELVDAHTVLGVRSGDRMKK